MSFEFPIVGPDYHADHAFWRARRPEPEPEE